MKKTDLTKMLDSVSLQDLQSLIAAKGKLDKLLEKKASIEKELASVDKQIESMKRSFEKTSPRKAPARTASAASRKKKARRKKASQPSIQSLIVGILQEKKKPLSVNEISEILLQEKKYKTKSANFKNQLRVLLYRNQKGLFRKTGAGRFNLASAGAAAAGKGAAPGKKASVKKKAAAKKKPAAPKKLKVKKTAAKKKTVVRKKAKTQKAAPKK